ncbi:tRNA dihydrouridine synthase DusB [Pelagibacterium lacus]|uniref:tRNA-dihydrouridine synthase n=1 Tax=Pelagibacterium lacus TaxID=2282655 RepID=A0A369W1S2_9HYPH|nr:tRNA dihydrouridine synthase DusB [Pelagibacterium lacus]RDE08634.1 tRNA dihydrouridine synthase DusB [Pelagibacterium lacus]
MSLPASRISIGQHVLPNRAFLAPMAGITDQPMRDLAARFGAGMVVSEMIASAALVCGQQEMVRKLAPSKGLPHIVQLAGCEAEWLVRGAELARDAGADIIDLNFGCPSKRVTNGYAGSALMRVPDIALRLVEAVVAATDLPVTVKMRLGWADDSLNAAEIARSAEGAGVRMITVHGRTRQQFYKGTARWELVRPVVEAVSIPVVVNGDIVDAGTAATALELSGAQAVMIGRGAQGQPWIVGQIAAALDGERPRETPHGKYFFDIITTHYDDMLTQYGTELGVRVARKHLGWYLDAAGLGEHSERRRLMTAETPEEVHGLLPELVSVDWSTAA